MELQWVETSCPSLPDGVPVPMQQHPIYGAACVALGSGVRSFDMRDPAGRLLGAAQVLERPVPFLGRAALFSRGPVWSRHVVPAQRRAGLLYLLQHLKRDHRIVAVTPEPCEGVDPLERSGWLEAVSPCYLARLELDTDVAAMRARQQGKWRNRLVAAERAGLAVRQAPMPADAGHWLLMKEAEQARARRYRRLPPAFTVEWVQRGGKGAARLFTAESEGAPIAAMLFLLHGTSATYHVGWSGPEGRRLGAHNLLLWTAQNWLAARGVRCLDLDLVDTRNAPGIARFKIGSGADVVALGATRLSAPGTGFFAQGSTKAESGPLIRQAHF